MALEQLRAHFVLQPPDLQPERRLRYMEPLGSAADAAEFANDDESLQLTQSHVALPQWPWPVKTGCSVRHFMSLMMRTPLCSSGSAMPARMPIGDDPRRVDRTANGRTNDGRLPCGAANIR